MPLARRWRFHGYEFDGRTGEIRRGAGRTFAPPHAATVLQSLLERPGELVEREALARRLWRDHPLVDVDHGLNAAVSRLRALLGDRASRPRFVETIPGRGYRFVAPCAVAEAFSSFVVLPFADFGEEHARAFSEELGEELTVALSARLARRVVSWLTASTYRGTERRLPEIARELDVDAALVGGILLADERNHVSVGLLDARADASVWAQGYDAGRVLTPTVVVDLAATIADDVLRAAEGSPEEPPVGQPAGGRRHVRPRASSPLPSGSRH
jgi:DNA-binding winged helix-turn-helix (wHTH) protein